MRFMGAEERKGKVCKTCKATVSVKYTQDGDTWCNRCVLKQEWSRNADGLPESGRGA